MTNQETSTSETSEVEAAVNQNQEEISDADMPPTGDDNPSDEALHLMLEDARAKADEHWNQLLRANAELENARRRARQDVENAHKYALEKFVQELLPVKDSLEMGLSATNADSDAVDPLREGIELTLKMLESTLEKFGIEAIDPAGEPFDPARHQAMSMHESAEHAPNTVMSVMQKGYELNQRLIRPAMVMVAKAPLATAETEATVKVGGQVDEKT
jgi:molecular chaperone GrpE